MGWKSGWPKADGMGCHQGNHQQQQVTMKQNYIQAAVLVDVNSLVELTRKANVPWKNSESRRPGVKGKAWLFPPLFFIHTWECPKWLNFDRNILTMYFSGQSKILVSWKTKTNKKTKFLRGNLKEIHPLICSSGWKKNNQTFFKIARAENGLVVIYCCC